MAKSPYITMKPANDQSPVSTPKATRTTALATICRCSAKETTRRIRDLKRSVVADIYVTVDQAIELLLLLLLEVRTVRKEFGGIESLDDVDQIPIATFPDCIGLLTHCQ